LSNPSGDLFADMVILIDFTYNGAVRTARFSLRQFKWPHVVKKGCDLFKLDADKVNALYYYDEEGDYIAIESNQELQQLWKERRGKPAGMPVFHLYGESHHKVADSDVDDLASEVASVSVYSCGEDTATPSCSDDDDDERVSVPLPSGRTGSGSSESSRTSLPRSTSTNVSMITVIDNIY
jgi:hypothetical protein